MDRQLFIGVDVGRTIRAALVNCSGEILLVSRVQSEVREPRVFIGQLIEIIEWLRHSDLGREAVAAVGIGWPGLVNQRTKRIELAPNFIADITRVDAYQELKGAIGLPLIFDNDANAAAYAEWTCGAARGFRDVFYTGIGTGIGSAIILGGQLQRGALGFAGEFGHCKVDGRGIECGCGGVGCLETVASGPNIVRRVREKVFSDPALSVSRLAAEMQGTLTLQRVVEAAVDGDELAQTVLKETGAYLGAALANVINLLNIELVVIGGPVMTAGHVILEAVREETRKHSFTMSFECCRFVIGQLGQDAGIIGAAMLAWSDAEPNSHW